MQFAKLNGGYYLAREVAGLSETAEVLLTRATAYCAAAETHGYVPSGVIPGLIRNPTPKRVRAACAELSNAYPDPLWTEEPGGFRLVKWEEEQAELEALISRRRNEASRQRAYRERQRQSPGQGVIPGIT